MWSHLRVISGGPIAVLLFFLYGLVNADCPAGYIYEGGICKMLATELPLTVPPLTNQQPLVTNDTQRPRCLPNITDPCLASSGIVTGKAYQLISSDGTYWGLTVDYHSWSVGSANLKVSDYQIGSFKFCMDEPCTSGIPINPSDVFSIQDIVGLAPAGINAHAWVFSYAGPDKLVRTYQFSRAGVFIIAKYPGGLYCIGGASPTGSAFCPGSQAGISFAGSDVQYCVKVQVQEFIEPVTPAAPAPTVTVKSTEVKVVTETTTVTTTSPTPSGQFTCDKTAYHMGTPDQKIHTLYKVDLAAGTGSTIAVIDGSAQGWINLNALGYNSRDNFLYATAAKPSGTDYVVVRLTNTGAWTKVLEFSTDANINICGDFDLYGQYWLSAAGTSWVQIDLLPGSPTYAKVVNKGVSAIDSGFGMLDWAYLTGRGEYMFAMSTYQGHLALIKWSLSSHTWSVHQQYPNAPAIGYPGVVGGNDDTIHGLANGQITQVNLGGGTPVTYKGLPFRNGDSARCALGR